jgi:hypothetical protein
MALIDLTSQRFGRLLVLKEAPPHRKPSGFTCRRYYVRCDCGTEFIVLFSSLRSGETKSCGCLKIEAARERGLQNLVHGHARTTEKTPEYRSWRNMIDRCENPEATYYDRYGGRGIKVCAEWRNSFAVFLKDVGPRPPGHTLDRIGNDGNYEPGNVRWATQSEQARNRTSNHQVIYRGRTMPLADAITTSGDIVKWDTAKRRLDLGWPVARAVETPSRKFPL